MNTKFEDDLKTYFPDIYKLHELGKAEAHVWDVITVLLEMRDSDVTGRVTINYSRGHIDRVRKESDVLAHKSSRPPSFEAGEESRVG